MSVLNVGAECERVIDGEWYKAKVTDISQVETVAKDGTAQYHYTYSLKYHDDGNQEADVEQDDIRLPTNVDRNPTPPAAMKGSKAPKYFPGNIQLYKEAAVTNNSLNEDESNPTISLSTYRQILKQLTRPVKSTPKNQNSTLKSQEDPGCSLIKNKNLFLRRHSFCTISKSFGAKPYPRQCGNFAPFAGKCENCSKWTIYRCFRCSSAYYCSRTCQKQMWPQHSCFEKEFRMIFNYDRIVERHAVLSANNRPMAEEKYIDVEARASLNPLHHRKNTPSVMYNTPCDMKSSISINMNSGLSNIAEAKTPPRAPAEIEMQSWYKRVKASGAEEMDTDNEVDGYAADNENVSAFEELTPIEKKSDMHLNDFKTPPRPKASQDTSVDPFSAGDAANLANMLNVRVEAAVTALKRCKGDANAAAEWLLTLPTYVDASRPEDTAVVHPIPLDSSAEKKGYIYERNNINVVQADLDGDSKYAHTVSPDIPLDENIELYSGQYSIHGRECTIEIIQNSRIDFSTTITIRPRGHAVLCPVEPTSTASIPGEMTTLIKSEAPGNFTKTEIPNSLITRAPKDGVPEGFEVKHLPPPPEIDLNDIDEGDEYQSSGSSMYHPRDHVMILQEGDVRKFLETNCRSDGVNPEALMNVTEQANFQRARRIIKALTPYYVNPFEHSHALSSYELKSSVPIGHVSNFPRYYVLRYKILCEGRRATIPFTQSVQPERIYLQLGTLEVSQNSEVAERASLARDELFEGSRVEPAPIISTNPFVESNTASDDDDDDMPPPLIEINDHDINEADVLMIVEMFNLSQSEAEMYLRRAGTVENAANLILTSQDYK